MSKVIWALETIYSKYRVIEFININNFQPGKFFVIKNNSAFDIFYVISEEKK